MRVGVPKEVKAHEYRVGLTPAAAGEYIAAGHEVLVESGCGVGSGAPDQAYEAIGAEIVAGADQVFERADMIIKVKEPQQHEWRQLRPGQILFTYLHLAADRDQAVGLAESGCTAVAYETVTDAHGGLPLLAPMSEVAGRFSIEAAGTALRRHAGGRGLLIGGVPGVQPARIVVLGAGVVGAQAIRMAVGLGAEVTAIDRTVRKLRELDKIYAGRVRTRMATRATIEEEVIAADVVIGAVLVPGATAPKLVDRSLLSKMKRGAVLVDVAIDQGGCFETSRPTTHADPTYEVDGVIHYCVSNMPGSVPVTSSNALNNATLPYGLALAAGGTEALTRNAYLRSGLNVHRGAITSSAVATSLGLPYVPADHVLTG